MKHGEEQQLWAWTLAGLCLGGVVVSVFGSPEIDCSGEHQARDPGRPVRVMTYNIQFLAGGIYEIWKGPQAVEALQVEQQQAQLEKIASLIEQQAPDILLLQEVDIDSRVNMNQVQWFIDRLGHRFSCRSHTAYTRLNGRVAGSSRKLPGSLQLLTLSTLPIVQTSRLELARMPDQSRAPLSYQRAALEVQVDLGKSRLTVMNTHLDAFAQGMDTMQQQVSQLEKRLSELTDQQQAWILAGDFNLLPAGQYELLAEDERHWYQPQTELTVLTDRFSVIPTVEQASGKQRKPWLTQATRPEYGLDRTLDYLFYSNRLSAVSSKVIHGRALDYSDHMPVVAEFNLAE